MLNIIRTTPKRIEYCGGTVDALIKSNRHYRTDIHIISDPQPKSLRNAMNQLEYAIEHGDEWFCLMEDDIRVISDFDESVRLWIRDCDGSHGSPCYPLGAAYKDVKESKGIVWKWPIQSFYGTQAVVFNRTNAISLLAYLQNPENPSHEFDLQIKDWARTLGCTHLLTPCPGFVQHIGVASSLHAGRFHWYDGFAGTEWSYVPRSSAFSPAEAETNKFDVKLAAALVEHFGKGSTVYDFGCGRDGKYIKSLRDNGLIATGYEITPGSGSEFIVEADLSRVIKAPEQLGCVMSLEVAEHINPEFEQTFLRNLSRHCSGKLVLSWAVPGQGGVRHVNERGEVYVINRMKEWGFALDEAMTQRMREAASILWFKKSIYVFTR